MPEILDNKKIFSLIEVTRSIQKTLNDRYASSFWIKAEMNKLNYYSHSGHCYPELVEKVDGRVVAQMRSTLWSDDYYRVNETFLKMLNEPLKDGIKILFLAKVKFDPSYGISLHIQDIDPSYTLGDLEKEKQETIQKLKKDNLFDQNKKHELALLPQRLAIISVETSKGFADFMEVINKNPWGYRYFHMLFPAILQGENAIESINFQLSRIAKVKSHFDAVVIIRGGGGDVGLSCYNNYGLAKSIALFPLPVLTGIGHATNETVCEMISFMNAITPTKLAEFLIQQFHNFSIPLREGKETIVKEARHIMDEAASMLQAEAKLFRSLSGNVILKNHNLIHTISRSLLHQSQYTFRREQEYLLRFLQNIKKDSQLHITDSLRKVQFSSLTIQKDSATHIKKQQNALVQVEKDVQNMSPDNVLKRGYSITLLNGKAIKSIGAVTQNDTITTTVYDGFIESTVQSFETKKS